MPASPAPRTSEAFQALELLREHSLATIAQNELERRIISGEIAAGSKLNEVDVAGALGVSRGPVREAFRALSQAGLVRVEKNRGVFVRQVSLDEANEYYEVRAALEGLIGRLAARRISIDEIESPASSRRLRISSSPSCGDSSSSCAAWSSACTRCRRAAGPRTTSP